MQLDIPKQSEIAEAIKKAREELRTNRLRKDIIVNRIKLIQNACTHPEKRRVSYMGEVCNKCTTCGKEW